MNILKAFGIIMVVIGHVSKPFKLFTPYSFHMALFIFVSGYFYNYAKYEENPFDFIRKRFRMIIYYFLYNLFYAVVNYYHFKLYLDIPKHFFTLKNFFIMPFMHGHQYLFIVPAWFIPALFIIQVTFLFVHKYLRRFITSKTALLIIYLTVACGGILLANSGRNRGIYLPLVRTCFGFFFYYLGIYYREALESKNIFNIINLGIVLLIQNLLHLKYGDIDYGLAWGMFNRNFMLPIITSITGIYFYTYLSKVIYRDWKRYNPLILIGRHTFSIMINHLFVFLLLNIIIIKINHIHYIQIVISEYFYKLDNYWLLYVSCGIIFPTIASVLYEYVRDRLRLAVKKT
jgi:fucose 4-O-acetylase-like acetyltransferase